MECCSTAGLAHLLRFLRNPRSAGLPDSLGPIETTSGSVNWSLPNKRRRVIRRLLSQLPNSMFPSRSCSHSQSSASPPELLSAIGRTPEQRSCQRVVRRSPNSLLSQIEYSTHRLEGECSLI